LLSGCVGILLHLTGILLRNYMRKGTSLLNDPKADKGVAYGTAELADLCGFAHSGSGAGRLKAIAVALARRPRRVQALLSLRDLPIVELRLSAAEHERWLHSRWPAGGESLFGGHWAQAVIQTSLDEHEYLKGRHRQAVRTNIRRARELGIVATRLGGYDEFVAASAPVYDSRRGGDAVLAATRRPTPSEKFAWYSASTPDYAAPVIVAAVALFGDFAVLVVMVGNRHYAHVGYVRYLLHTFILCDLAAGGTRHLIVGPVLRESSGNQYFQRLLGYRVCNLRPILVPQSGAQRNAAAVQRMLMTGPIVESASRSSREDPHDLKVAAPVDHAEWPTTDSDGDANAFKVGARAGGEDGESAL